MGTERTQVEWRFWLWWVLASTAGWGLGLAVGVAAGFAVGYVTSFDTGVAVGYALGFATAGVVLAAAQGLVLRRQISRWGWWVLASIVGFSVAFAVVFVVLEAGASALFDAGIAAVVGASVGAAQWLVLRRQVSRAGWWVLASAVGLAVAVALGGAARGAVGGIEAGAVAGVVYGAITGGVMVWLLRQPVIEEPSPPQEASIN